MNHHFNNVANDWPISTKPYKRAPVTDKEKSDLVDALQDAKTEFYTSIIEDKAEARDGVLELMDEAINHPNIKVYYYTTILYYIHELHIIHFLSSHYSYMYIYICIYANCVYVCASRSVFAQRQLAQALTN